MIKDQQRLADIRQQWTTVAKLCQSPPPTYQSHGGFVNETRPADSYNLPFVLAFAVLDQVFDSLIDQGEYACKSRQLGAKMKTSEKVLPWKDYALVDAARMARNRLAHLADLRPKDECLKHVAAIESELKAWKILRLF